MATKIPFRTILTPCEITGSVSGEEYEDVWAMKLDEKGNEKFYVSGRTNVYEKIQSHKDECDLEKIIERVTMTGDDTILNKVRTDFFDATTMPKNYIEAHNQIMEAENNFNRLPLEIRKKYDFNFHKYLADMGSEKWMNVMGFNKTEETIKEEVKTEDE